MSEAIAWLRRLLPRLSELGPDGERLAQAIEQAQSNPHLSLEQAAALPPNWRALFYIVARDEAIRRYVDQHLSELSLRRQADEILTAARRLRASGADLRRIAAGTGARAELAALLLTVSPHSRAHRDALPSARQIRRLLGHLPPTPHGPTNPRDSTLFNRRQP